MSFSDEEEEEVNESKEGHSFQMVEMGDHMSTKTLKIGEISENEEERLKQGRK